MQLRPKKGHDVRAKRTYDPRLWRACGYCGATVRASYCGKKCKYAAQMLRDIEVRGVRRRTGTAYVSEWEDAVRESRLAHVRRLLSLGCQIDIALDEAGFLRSEWAAAEQALRRRGVKWPCAGWFSGFR